MSSNNDVVSLGTLFISRNPKVRLSIYIVALILVLGATAIFSIRHQQQAQTLSERMQRLGYPAALVEETRLGNAGVNLKTGCVYDHPPLGITEFWRRREPRLNPDGSPFCLTPRQDGIQLEP